MKDQEFLLWLHQRLNAVYGENKNADHMWRLRAIAANTPEDKITPNCKDSLTWSDNGISITKYEEKK